MIRFLSAKRVLFLFFLLVAIISEGQSIQGSLPILFPGLRVPPPVMGDTNVILVVANETAVFPGGEKALLKFLIDSMSYTDTCKNDSTMSGRVLIQFIVEKDGSISNIESILKKKACPAFTSECIRVIGLMPRWRPGYLSGKPVRMAFTVLFRKL